MTIIHSDTLVANGLPLASMLSLAVTTVDANNWASAISIVLGALFFGAVQIIAARAAARKAVREELAPVTEKLERIEPVVDKINVHVNSEKDRALGELAQRDLQIELQREMIDELKKSAGLLAQAKALTETSNAVAQAAGSTTPPPPSQ